jgi:hypothetical protein
MANFEGHITTSTVLGAAYAAAAAYYWPTFAGTTLDWGAVFLGAGLTAVGGLVPDLDSDSGVPVRELFGLAGAFSPILAIPWLRHYHLNTEQTLVVLGAIYLLIRYGAAAVFKGMTVHRGMFHSLPGMVVAGLVIFLLYKTPDLRLRVFLTVGVMIGFLSHLVLDELCAVDLMGLTPKLNQFAGSALKIGSASWSATAFTYLALLALAWAAWITT